MEFIPMFLNLRLIQESTFVKENTMEIENKFYTIVKSIDKKYNLIGYDIRESIPNEWKIKITLFIEGGYFLDIVINWLSPFTGTIPSLSERVYTTNNGAETTIVQGCYQIDGSTPRSFLGDINKTIEKYNIKY